MAGERYMGFRKLIRDGSSDKAKKSDTLSISSPKHDDYMSYCYIMKVNDPQGSRSRGLALHLAVRNGNVEGVEMLLRSNCINNSKHKSTKILPHVICPSKTSDHCRLLPPRDDIVNYVYTFRETPLHVAVKNKDERIIKLLLDHGADVNAAANNQKTPLHYAVEYKYRETAKILIRRGARINSKIENDLTALHVAVKNKDYKMVRLLLKSGIDVNARDANGVTPLYLALVCECYEITKMLLGAGAVINGPLYFSAETMLSEAVYYKDEKMVKFLLDNGAHIHLRNRDGKTPLQLAVEGRCEEITKLLLSKGANVNYATDLCGQTVLHIALKSTKNERMIAILLDYNANFDAKDTNGKSPWNFAAEYKSTNANIVEMFLWKGAFVDEKIIWGTTALHNAVGVAAKETVKVLLEHRADVNAKDDTGKAPLHHAAGNLFKAKLFTRFHDIGNFSEMQSRFERIVEMLLEKGARIDDTDNNGETALYDAATNGHEGIVKLLLARNANVNAGTKALPVLHFRKEGDFYQQCQTEVAAMKSDELCGKMTFYDVLTKSRNDVIACVRNEFVIDAFNSKKGEFREKYPMYADMLIDRYRKAEEGKQLRESAEMAMNFAANMVLPYLVTQKIFSYLSAKDLKKLVSVFEKCDKREAVGHCKVKSECPSCRRRNTFSSADGTSEKHMRQTRTKRMTWL